MSKLKIENNPLDIAIKVFEKNYPEYVEKIDSINFALFDNQENSVVECFGDENNEFYDIYLKEYEKIKFKGFNVVKRKKPIPVEIVAINLLHQFAHIVVGNCKEHNNEFKKVFNDLVEKYKIEQMNLFF